SHPKTSEKQVVMIKPKNNILVESFHSDIGISPEEKNIFGDVQQDLIFMIQYAHFVQCFLFFSSDQLKIRAA
ncbi:MAG: hypothetical protein ACLFQY_20350, partial [Desulfococcaceae bacterium]